MQSLFAAAKRIASSDDEPTAPARRKRPIAGLKSCSSDSIGAAGAGLAVTPLVSQEKNAGMTDQKLSKGGSFGN